MKHAGPDALDRLEPLIAELAGRMELKERSRGVFYRKSKPYLHFHEEGDLLYADLKAGDEFERHEVTTKAQQSRFLKLVERSGAES